MLTEETARSILAPFELHLDSHQLGQLLTYLELLLRWNKSINLTAVRTAEACLTRHFGESLYLSRWLGLQGKLLDIGSGAGFPGLALKITFPRLSVTLLEPGAKKRAFLKEAARVCGMEAVEVRPERLEEFVETNPAGEFETVTTRAVGHMERLVPLAVQCLTPLGCLCLWVTRTQGESLRGLNAVSWGAPIPIPTSREREIWVGTRKDRLRHEGQG